MCFSYIFDGDVIMDKKIQEKITNLRLKGLGYKAIAAKLELSRDTVRHYCRKNNLTGYAEAVKLNHEEMLENGTICPNCSKVLKQPAKGKKKRFCSDKCRSEWWSKNYELHNFSEKNTHSFICRGCGKKFTSYSNKSRKYCSHECYIKHRFGGQQLTK
jgi:hypothetical protein